MGNVSLPHLFEDFVNQTASGEEVMDNLEAILAQVNGNIEAINLAAEAVTADKLGEALSNRLGVTANGVKRSGKSIISEEQTRDSTSYGFLDAGSPDRVTSIYVPPDGLVELKFTCLWSGSHNECARAAIFIGANQLKNWDTSQAQPAVQEAKSSDAAKVTHLYSVGFGLWDNDADVSHTSPVDTGMSFGSTTSGGKGDRESGASCTIRDLPEGTYDFSIQFKVITAARTVTAKERKLFVESKAY